MLEYPPTQLALSSPTSIKYLQLIQNKALKFIYNVKWDDFITNESLHTRSKLMPIKERINLLKDKAIEHLKQSHFVDVNQAIYKFSDFSLAGPPLKPRTNEVRKLFDTYNSGLFN